VSGTSTLRPGRRGPAFAAPAWFRPPATSRLPGWCAVAAIVAALLIMIASALLRSSWMPPALPMPRSGPPWELASRVPDRTIVVALWAAGLLAGAGVATGLAAARRGLPIPVATLIGTAAVAVVALVLLPPVGSTDSLDYAIYGHIAALGHSPYVMTPAQYGHLIRDFAGVPRDWEHDPSVYGPLATAEQLAAARLGGASLAATAFWLRLANAIAFGAVAFAADRSQRAHPAGRARVHLLWTANPLVIWSAVAGGHIDLIAAAIGLAGLLILERKVIASPLPNALAAGLCVGAAADLKADFALYGLALAWCLRDRPGQLLAAAAGAAIVLIPSYALAGLAAVRALSARAYAGQGYGFYGFFFRRLGISLNDAVPLAVCLLIPVAWLALQRFPDGLRDRAVVRAAVALSLAWLLVWPHQFAWYSLAAFCVLAFYPASRLDWLAVAWLTVMTIADMPGTGTGQGRTLGHALLAIQYVNLTRLAPLVMLAVLIALLGGCLTRRWHGLHSGLAPA
jgi:hypothetical protein